MSTLVGRHRELQVLVTACKDGHGCVIVRGAPGVGKSRLLAAATEDADLLGHTVLHAGFGGLDRDVPYAGLRTALWPILISGGGDRDAGSVKNVFDLRLEDVGDTRAGLSAAFDAGVRMLGDLAESGPVVVAVDDLHAADSDTIRVLSLLVAHLRNEQITFLLAARPPGPDVTTEVEGALDRLEAEGLATTLALGELDEAETRALVHSLLDRRPDDALVAAVRQAGRGNPFFVTEALRSLRDDDRVVIDDRGARLVSDRGPLNVSARAAMVHRVFELGPAPRRLVRVLTAMQRITLTRLDVAAEIAGLDETDVDTAFDTLVSSGVLRAREDGGFEFAHPIVRSTLYDDIGPAERRRMHQRLAERLQSDRAAGRHVTIAEIAAHVAASAEAGDTGAATLLLDAGREIVASAPLTASRWFAQARHLLGDDGSPVHPDRDPSGIGPILAEEARALFLAARPFEAAETAQRAVHGLPPGTPRDRISAVLLQSLTTLGRYDEALDIAEELERTQSLSASVRAVRAQVLTFANRLFEAKDDLDRALADATHPATTATVLGASAANAYPRGDLDSCFRHLDDQAALDARIGPGSRLASLVLRASYLSLLGRLHECDDALAQARELAELQGGASYAALLDVAGATRDWFAGEWDAVVDGSRRVGVDPDRAGAYGSLARVAELAVSVDRGEFGRARELADEVSSGVALGSSFAAWGVARLDAALGEMSSARDRLERVLAADETAGRLSSSHLLLATLAEFAIADNDPDAATAHADALQVLTVDAPVVATLRYRTQGLVARDAEPVREAQRIAEANGLVVEAARADLLLGELTGDADHLMTAYKIFGRLGAEPILRRTMAAMRDAGVTVPDRHRQRDRALTDTEAAMARLVHEGLTNRQIARVLFLSPKTIEVYLSRVFTKTDCANRLELALAVADGRVDVS